MAKRDDVLRKLQRQESPETPPEREEPPAETSKGHPPAAGTSKVTMNLRDAIWKGSEDAPGLVERAEDAGVPPVAIVEALLERYLTDEKVRERTNNDALRVVRARRQLSAQLRRLARSTD